MTSKQMLHFYFQLYWKNPAKEMSMKYSTRLKICILARRRSCLTPKVSKPVYNGLILLIFNKISARIR